MAECSLLTFFWGGDRKERLRRCRSDKCCPRCNVIPARPIQASAGGWDACHIPRVNVSPSWQSSLFSKSMRSVEKLRKLIFKVEVCGERRSWVFIDPQRPHFDLTAARDAFPLLLWLAVMNVPISRKIVWCTWKFHVRTRWKTSIS